LGDVAFASSSVVKWLLAGEDSPHEFPIAARAYEHLSSRYDFGLSGGDALSADIQRLPRHQPRSAMIRTADLVSFLTEEFGQQVLTNFAGSTVMPSRRPLAAPAKAAAAAAKRLSTKEKAALKVAKKKAAVKSAEAWSCVDILLHAEFTQLAAFLHTETHAAVPAGAADLSLEIPKPILAIIYGLGGTGKSFVLRAFQTFIDRDARALLAASEAARSAGEDDGHAGIVIDPVLFSKDLIETVAPSGVAACAIGGTTCHAAFSFPRSQKDKKEKKDKKD
jgi:hypothetical protein